MADEQAMPYVEDTLFLAEDGTGDVVHGVPISNESLALAIRRVIVLASVVATYYICGFISNLLTGMYGSRGGSPSELWSGLSQLAIELSIPACGYYGAVYAHRTLIFFFCGANLIFIVASAIGFFRLLVVLGSSSRDMCKQEYASAKTTCEVMLGEGLEKYMLLSSLALLTVLGCFSFVAGKRLYQSLHPFDLSSVPAGADRAPLVGEVIVAGPGMASALSPGAGVAYPEAAAPARSLAFATAAGVATSTAAAAAAAGAAPAVDRSPLGEPDEAGGSLEEAAGGSGDAAMPEVVVDIHYTNDLVDFPDDSGAAGFDWRSEAAEAASSPVERQLV